MQIRKSKLGLSAPLSKQPTPKPRQWAELKEWYANRRRKYSLTTTQSNPIPPQ